MEYKKPQSTIIQGNVGIYPLTTADQVILADGTRLEKDGKINVDVANSADSAKLGGKAPEYYIQPRNLLDNSDFRNPVNQRGKTSYSGTTYTIDRWYISGGSCTIENGNGVIVSSPDDPKMTFMQFLENIDVEKVYTFAIKDSDGNVYLIQSTPGERIEENTSFGTIIAKMLPNDDITFAITISAANSKKFIWAALYEGSYTADTLPPYVPKGYAAELAECRRYYYQSFSGWNAKGWDGIILCEAITTSRTTNVSFPQTMRIEKPTIDLYSPYSGVVGKISEFVSDTEVDASAIYLTRDRFMLSNDAHAFEIGKHYCIHYAVSADL